jgi:hypothetical protein
MFSKLGIISCNNFIIDFLFAILDFKSASGTTLVSRNNLVYLSSISRIILFKFDALTGSGIFLV